MTLCCLAGVEVCQVFVVIVSTRNRKKNILKTLHYI